jgi:flagellar FliJ protein
MSWRNSLVRLAGYEVEELRKRLAAILDRRSDAEMRLALLHAEAEAEKRRAEMDPQAGWCWPAYIEGWKIRRDRIHQEIAAISSEEAGARDALGQAFEHLKKFEQVQEMALEQERKEAAKRETAELDELGGRRAAAGAR